MAMLTGLVSGSRFSGIIPRRSSACCPTLKANETALVPTEVPIATPWNRKRWVIRTSIFTYPDEIRMERNEVEHTPPYALEKTWSSIAMCLRLGRVLELVAYTQFFPLDAALLLRPIKRPG